MKSRKLLLFFAIIMLFSCSIFLSACGKNTTNGVIETVGEISKIYDGEEVSLPTFVKKGDGKISIEWYSGATKLDSAPIDAGEYKIKVLLEKTERYNEASFEKAFVISKANNQITNISSLDQVYGAEAPTLSYSSTNGETGVAEFYQGATKLNGRPSMPGVYKVKVTTRATKNYLESSSEKEFTISKAVPTYTTPTDIVANYGVALSTVELPQGFAWKDSSASVGNIGFNTHFVTYTPNNTSIYANVENIPIVISVVSSGGADVGENLNVSAHDIVAQYDGTDKTISVELLDNAIGGVISYSNSRYGVYGTVKPAYINAGEYTIFFKVEKNGYITYWGSSLLTINKKAVARPTADATVFTYDGNPKTYNPQGFDNSIMTISGNIQTSPNAFGYSVKVALKDVENYKWQGTGADPTFSFVIAKGQDEITGISDLSHMFGSDYPTLSYSTKSGASTSIFYMVGSSLQSAKPTNAGTYKVVVRTSDSDNYIGVSAEQSFEITKSRDEIRQISDLSQTYGAHAPTISFKVASGSTANVTYYLGTTLLGARPINAGTYKVRIEVAESQNHTGTTVEKSYVIGKTSDLISNISNLNQIYNDEFPELDYLVESGQAPTISFFSGNTLLDERPTEVGSYKVVLSTTGNQNYFGTIAEKAYKISKAQSTITNISSLAQTYGETPPELTCDKVGDGEISVEYYHKTTLLDSRPLNAGEGYRVVIKMSEGENYLGTSAQAEYAISPKAFEESAITCSDVVTNYDGAEKSINVLLAGEAEGAVVEYYSASPLGFYLVKPTFVNSCSNQEIKFRVSKANYLPYTSSNYVTINKIASVISNISDLSQDYKAITVPALTYDKVGDGVVAIAYKNGEETLSARPSNAGNYTVVVSIAEGLNYLASFAERDYVINRIEPTYVLPSGLTARYGNALSSIVLSANWSWETPTTLVGPLGANNHLLTYTPSDQTNYLVKSGVSVSVNVLPRQFLASSIFSSNVFVDYDGEEKSINVSLSGEAEDATISYRTNSSEEYSATNPTHTLGKHTIYYKVSKENYVDYFGSNTLLIVKRIAAPTIGEATFEYSQANQTYIPNGFNSETMSITNNVHMFPGQYTAVVTIKNSNENRWLDGTNTILNFDFAINKKQVVEPTISGYTYNYINYEAVIDFEDSPLWYVRNNSNMASERGTYTMDLGLPEYYPFYKWYELYEWVDAAGNPEDGLVSWSCENGGSLSSLDANNFIVEDSIVSYYDKINLEVGCTLADTSDITISYAFENSVYEQFEAKEVRDGVTYYSLGSLELFGNLYYVGTHKIYYRISKPGYHTLGLIANLIIDYEEYTQKKQPAFSQPVAYVGNKYSTISLFGGDHVATRNGYSIGGGYSFKQPDKLFVEGLNTCAMIFSPNESSIYGKLEFEIEIYACEIPYKSLTINDHTYNFSEYRSYVSLKAFPGVMTTISFPAIAGYIIRNEETAINSISLGLDDGAEIKIFSASTLEVVQIINFHVRKDDCINFVSFEYADGTIDYYYNNTMSITVKKIISKIRVDVDEGYTYKMYFNGKLYDRTNPRGTVLHNAGNDFTIVVGELENGEMINERYYVKYSLYVDCFVSGLFSINGSDISDKHFFRASSLNDSFVFVLNNSYTVPEVEYKLYKGDTSIAFNLSHQVTQSENYTFERRAKEGGEIVLLVTFDVYYMDDIDGTPTNHPVNIIGSDKFANYYLCITRNGWESTFNVYSDNTFVGFGEDVPRIEEFTLKMLDTDNTWIAIPFDENNIIEMDGEFLRLKIFNTGDCGDNLWYGTAIRILGNEIYDYNIADDNVLVNGEIYDFIIGEDRLGFTYNDETAVYEADLSLARGDIISIFTTNPKATVVGLDGIVFENEFDNEFIYQLLSEDRTFTQKIRFQVLATDGVTIGNYEINVTCSPKLSMSIASSKDGQTPIEKKLFFDYADDPSGTFPSFYDGEIVVGLDEDYGVFVASSSLSLADFDIYNDEGGLWIEGNGDKFVKPSIFVDFGVENLYYRDAMTMGVLLQPDAGSENLYSNILYKIKNNGTNDYFEFLLVIGDDYKTYVLCTVLLTND